MASPEIWQYRNSFEIKLIFAASMHHRHFRDQDQTVVHQLIDCYTFAHTIFLLHVPKASWYQKYVAGRWFFLEL